MNTRTITLGDGTVVLITYDSNGRVLSITSQNPIFVFLVTDRIDVYIGTFTDQVIATLFDLPDLLRMFIPI